MRRLYRLVLQKLRGYLDANLLVNGDIIDKLLSTLVLDATEAEIIEHQICNRDQIEHLITILLQKDDQSYLSFKECLEKANGFILEKIEETEIVCASGMIFKHVRYKTGVVWYNNVLCSTAIKTNALYHFIIRPLDTVIMGNLWSWSYGNWELFDFCSL
jgi:hypothetical protein